MRVKGAMFNKHEWTKELVAKVDSKKIKIGWEDCSDKNYGVAKWSKKTKKMYIVCKHYWFTPDQILSVK